MKHSHLSSLYLGDSFSLSLFSSHSFPFLVSPPKLPALLQGNQHFIKAVQVQIFTEYKTIVPQQSCEISYTLNYIELSQLSLLLGKPNLKSSIGIIDYVYTHVFPSVCLCVCYVHTVYAEARGEDCMSCSMF